MRLGLVLLSVAYILSQFYRSFLAVLSDVLQSDVGATPDALATASGVWFLVFALCQIPVGYALDTIGPRRLASVVLALGGAGGAAVFAMAQSATGVTLAMGLIGFGCSPVLMASYYIFARQYSAKMFATLAATVIGVGTLGNLAGTLPLTWLAEVIGWREVLWGLAALTGVIALGLWLTVEDPPKIESDQRGSVLDLLRIPALWLVFPVMFVNYAASGGLRAVWIGPYMRDVVGLEAQAVGTATLIMGLAMIAGTFLYAPLDRWLGTRKWVIIPGNALTAVACFVLWAVDAPGVVLATALFCLAGAAGMSFPLIIAHGRAFAPPHLVGRAVTLMNLFGIGGTGFFQLLSGRLQASVAERASLAASYEAVFLLFACITVLGLLPYLFARDRTD
ncbi:MFS transporter [Primorskyibacter sp. S187A]|uniref:MFS transporter n=1 Tax=Primorskyibacter sp. S187A TaxID=3415130 RepID=UPI003C7A950E